MPNWIKAGTEPKVGRGRTGGVSLMSSLTEASYPDGLLLQVLDAQQARGGCLLSWAERQSMGPAV